MMSSRSISNNNIDTGASARNTTTTEIRAVKKTLSSVKGNLTIKLEATHSKIKPSHENAILDNGIKLTEPEGATQPLLRGKNNEVGCLAIVFFVEQNHLMFTTEICYCVSSIELERL